MFNMKLLSVMELSHGTPLVPWINFNPSTDQNNICFKVWDHIIYQFPNVNGAAVEVWESIIIFTPHMWLLIHAGFPTNYHI